MVYLHGKTKCLQHLNQADEENVRMRSCSFPVGRKILYLNEEKYTEIDLKKLKVAIRPKSSNIDVLLQ